MLLEKTELHTGNVNFDSVLSEKGHIFCLGQATVYIVVCPLSPEGIDTSSKFEISGNQLILLHLHMLHHAVIWVTVRACCKRQ